jgi:hypothetical protein
VGDVDGGRPDPLLEALELVAGAGAQLGVKVGERLVEQEHVRLADQRAGQRDPLALPAGELARLAGEQVVDAEQLDRPACLALLLGLAEPLGPEREDDVLHDALVRVQGVALEDHGDLARPRGQLVDDPPPDEHLALGGLLEPGDGAQQRGLAAPRRAEEDEVLALLGGEVDAVDGVHAPAVELLDQLLDLDDDGHDALPTGRRRGRGTATSRRSA